MQKFKQPQYENAITKEHEEEQAEKELTSEELREKLRDPNFLPTREQTINAFTNHEEWEEFCFDEEEPVYDLYNKEYLNAFTDYFVDRIGEYGASKEKPLVILEIGAGNGRLSHFLEEELNQKVSGQVKVIATDSGEDAIKADFSVEQLKHDEAMEKYKPDIVIFSWMPYGEDSSKDIRKVDSVQEYILIGEAENGCCGDDWETWGNQIFDEEIPPYEVDGFQKEKLDDLSELQICRTDRMPGRINNSATVSFKRKK